MSDDEKRSKRVDPRDELAGRNLAILRGEVSQADLADRMRMRGWKWSQATVWAVEQGTRPLRLAEAKDVLEILEVGAGGIEHFLLREPVTADIARWGSEAHRRYLGLKTAIRHFRDAQFQLAVAYTLAQNEGVPLTQGDISAADSWLSPDVFKDAIAEVDRDLAQGFGGADPLAADDPVVHEMAAMYKGEKTRLFTKEDEYGFGPEAP